MDLTQALKDTENALRDFIAKILHQEYGEKWLEESGVSEARIKRWNERKATEHKRLVSGAVDERIIYYADFYDLKTILKKHWEKFSNALGEWRTIEVLLSELEKLRDPDAHRRELLPHQKHLAIGISGEIRTRLVRYRGKQETADDYFPQFESVRDSLGNIWTPQSIERMTITDSVLRPSDVLHFVVTAGDPLSESLEFGISLASESSVVWQDSPEFEVRVQDQHVGDHFVVRFYVRSQRTYHAKGSYDHSIKFTYVVLPPQR